MEAKTSQSNLLSSSQLPQSNNWKAGQPSDWQIRVHVIEARNLQPRDANGMSDPVCFASVHGKKKHTITHKKTTNCTWDHLMFFEFSKMIPEEFFRGKVKFTVFDANTISRNVEIGTFELDLTNIYQQRGHEMYRQWIALSDASARYIGVQGYLKISVSVLGPGDQAVAHEESEEDDENAGSTLQSMVLIPPSIRTTSHTLNIYLFKAEALPKMDTIGKCDGYVAVSFGGSEEMRTEIIKKEFNPTWQERISLPLTLPTMTDQIKIQIRDWDQGSTDEIVGTNYLSLNQILDPKANWKTPRWINFYGIPDGAPATAIGKAADIAKRMNEGYLEGTAFRGRLLISADTSATTQPKREKSKINAAVDPAAAKYLLRCDIMEAAELNTKKDISIEISVAASHDMKFKKVKVENGSASWYQSGDDLTLLLPADRNQVPDVFINFYKHKITSKTRIGYIRVKSTDLKPKSKPIWMPIEADIFSDKSKGTKIGGFLQFKVEFGLENQMGSKPPPVVKPPMKKYQLRAHIFQGKELIAADNNGLSDPYCIVRLGKHSAKTKIAKETVFPMWYETLTIPVELPENPDIAPDIHIQVYDWDMAGSDDFLGRASVPVTKISESMEQPTWYHLYLKDPAIVEGAVLCSFQIIPESQAASIPITPIAPKLIDCVLEISVVGLRDLLPYNMLPIMKPYVEFDVGGEQKVRTKISNQPSGVNPNFLEVLELPVKLPENRTFAPSINIRVFDDRLIKNLVATRSIPSTTFVPWENRETQSIQDLQENLPPPVEKIPGASVLGQLPKESTDSIKIDIKEKDDDKLRLLAEGNKDISTVQDMIRDASNRSNVSETYLTGEELDNSQSSSSTRDTIKHELEYDMKEPVFNVYKLYRGKKKNGVPIRVEVGSFKGRFRIYEASEKGKEKPLDLVSMYQPQDYIARIYILEAFQLVPKDIDGNNPYIRITNGKDKIKDVDDKKQKTSRPQFYKVYEMPLAFPLQTMLDISVWDWDPVTDELIGTTRVDLEGRFYSKQWQNQKLKPIEYRTLWNPSSTNPQGQLKLWIDVLTPDQAKRIPPEDITPPKPQVYELRVIVYETKRVILKDKGKSSDIFVVGFPEGHEPQASDTHWKCEDGAAQFNWRMKYKITLPNAPPNFKLQVWDRNAIQTDSVICEANLNLRSFYNRAFKKKSTREAISKQWISMTHSNAKGIQGEVNASFELLSEEEATRSPAGYGRDEPNMNPTLSAPVRPDTSFAPWDVQKQANEVIKEGKKFYQGWRVKMFACAACTIIVCILVFFIWLRKLFRLF